MATQATKSPPGNESAYAETAEELGFTDEGAIGFVKDVEFETGRMRIVARKYAWDLTGNIGASVYITEPSMIFPEATHFISEKTYREIVLAAYAALGTFLAYKDLQASDRAKQAKTGAL